MPNELRAIIICTILLSGCSAVTVKFPSYHCEKEYPKFDCPKPITCKGDENCSWICSGPVLNPDDLPINCSPIKEENNANRN